MIFKAVSLFCGCGGMDYGFWKSGFDIIWGVDIDINSCETNRKWSNSTIINSDINAIDIETIPKSDVILSSLFVKNRLNNERNESVNLNYITMEIISKKMPKAFICEGNSVFLFQDNGETFKNYLDYGMKLGYYIYYKIMNYKDHGIPQNRKKLIVIGIRNDFTSIFKFPEISNTILPIKEAFKCLNELSIDLNDRYRQHTEYIERNNIPYLNQNDISPTLYLNRLPINSMIPIKDDKKFTISYQEAAIIQSFPFEVEFIGNKRQKFQQITNAFAPKLAFELGNQIKKVLAENVELSELNNEDISNIEYDSIYYKGDKKMEKLMLPDRFEGLEGNREKRDILRIIIPVQQGIKKIIDLFEEIESSNRGAFLILKGKSGCGKTTFLRTLDTFVDNVEIDVINNNDSLVNEINVMAIAKRKYRMIVVEGRESLLDSNSKEINAAIHAINRFLRSPNGKSTLIVWPCNDKEIIDELVDTAGNIGGTALLNEEESYFEFFGPSKEHYLTIVKQTIELLNNGKTLLDFGIIDKEAYKLIDEVDTIGEFIKKISKLIRKNKSFVEELVKKEQCKLWIIVLGGNEPDKDVAALTKGEYLTADINRMLVSTNANIVEELKKYPDKIGMLSNYLDCRIIYMPIVVTLSVIREFADDKLREILKHKNLSDKKEKKGLDRLKNSELSKMINSDYKAQAKKGTTGSNSITAFEKLTEIAESNDKLLNKTFGKALVAAELIDEFIPEGNFGTGLTRRTDLVCKTKLGEIRLEFMWRKKTSQADIANYTLTKLYNYGRAIGILE